MEFRKKFNKVFLTLGTVAMGVSSLPVLFDLWTSKDASNYDTPQIMLFCAVIFGLASFIHNGYVVYLETGDKRTMRSQYPNFIGMVLTVVSILLFR